MYTLDCDAECVSYCDLSRESSKKHCSSPQYRGVPPGPPPPAACTWGTVWRGLWGQGPLPGRAICRVDFRISSVTWLGPENDRGPLCYSPCSRNAADPPILFSGAAHPWPESTFPLGRRACAGLGFLVRLRRSE